MTHIESMLANDPYRVGMLANDPCRVGMLANDPYKNRDVLMNAQSPHKWWSTLKSVVFGLSSLLPPLVGGGGGLVCESVGKVDLLSDHFDGKQSRESVDLPITCHPSWSLTSFAFRSSEVRRLLLDFDPYGGSYSLGMFPLFLKITADVLAPRHRVVFRRLAGDRPMSPLFQRVHRPPLLPTIDRFP